MASPKGIGASHTLRHHTIRKAPTELFAAFQADDGADSIPQPRPMREKHLWKYIVCFLIVSVLTVIGLYYGYNVDKNLELQVYNNTVYACLFFILCVLFLVLDHTDRFARFQSHFEAYGLSFLIAFVLIAFVDYLLIGLQEDALISGLFTIVFIEILYYIALTLFFCTFMSYWKSWSFHCAGKAWIHALLYLSLIGGLFIFICRWLHPPPTSKEHEDHTCWHSKHDTNSIIKSIISILMLLFLFCTVLGGIGICLFSEFAAWTAVLGIEIAFISFVAMSFLIMLTPLAPGSIIDACGGFVFVLILVPHHTGFFTAWGIAVVSVIVLHYCGACIQWWMGTWRSIQVWGNVNLPVEMLAASDAVLRDANFVKVGLVGYIFLDTANGLNQGRINMEFCTQLFSEWPAIPNALGLVSFGATIAASAIGLDGYDWTIDAVPLLIIFSTVVQAIGFTFGTREMAKCVDHEKYWCSREKWEMMHYFRKGMGYIPTRQGWEHDVFNLGNNQNNVSQEFKSILYDKVTIVHEDYLVNRDKLHDAQARLDLYKKYLSELSKIRDIHYDAFAKYLEEAKELKWLIYEEPSESKTGYFDFDVDEVEVTPVNADHEEDAGDKTNVMYEPDAFQRDWPCFKQYLYYVLVTMLIVTFWASFYGFYWTSDLEETVTGGIDILRNIAWYWYSTLFIFIAILVFIHHVEIISNSKSFCSAVYFVATGCRVHPDIETRFETPQWIPHKDRNKYVANDHDNADPESNDQMIEMQRTETKAP